jgi:exopolyphosphatase/guanosine-5'-triphosphate,3'-diphosphate pyrophosphatase
MLAGVDIGSNAIRMVIARQQNQSIEYLKKYRVPIRLGEDAFEVGEIQKSTMLSVIQTFVYFRSILQKYQVRKIKAVATSALRESKNGRELIKEVHKSSGVRIELIDGFEEAQLIHLGVSRAVDLRDKQALLMDVGGGSVELTLSDKGLMTSTQSFPFGTVRTLQMLKKRKLVENQIGILMGEYLPPLARFLHSQPKRFDLMIVTGGNADALGKLKERLLRKPNKGLLNYEDLSELVDLLQSYTQQARQEKLGLRKDRADVILPAALMFQIVLRQTGLGVMMIPSVGLKEGLIWSLVEKDS